MVVLQILYPWNWEVDYWKSNCDGEVPTVDMGLDTRFHCIRDTSKIVDRICSRCKIHSTFTIERTNKGVGSTTMPLTSNPASNNIDYLGLAKRLEKVEVQRLETLAAQIEMKATFKSSRVEVKNLIMDQLRTMKSFLQKQPS
uniref:Uncharacterized protein n=1 Tax=Cannabis sativa TaxID=3483 RepID=A0A803PH84_CANSA